MTTWRLDLRTYAVEIVFVLDVLSNKLQGVHRLLERRVDLSFIVSLGKPGLIVTKQKERPEVSWRWSLPVICIRND